MGIIWLATIWVIWKARNDKVFNDVNFEVDVIVEEVKVLAWKWVMYRMYILVCLFFEWCWNPQWCLRRPLIRPWYPEQQGCPRVLLLPRFGFCRCSCFLVACICWWGAEFSVFFCYWLGRRLYQQQYSAVFSAGIGFLVLRSWGRGMCSCFVYVYAGLKTGYVQMGLGGF